MRDGFWQREEMSAEHDMDYGHGEHGVFLSKKIGWMSRECVLTSSHIPDGEEKGALEEGSRAVNMKMEKGFWFCILPQ